MEKFFRQVQEFFRALSLNQKLLLGVAAVLVAVVLGVFVKLTQKADFSVLYSGLAGPDAQSVVQSLAAKNIPYEISSDGTSISVPTDQLDKTRMEMAAQGMPQTGRLGFELFDKPNWAGSDFAEQVNYQRALEGELERTIQTLGNVESVRVHLVLPHESLFSDRERVAKAAVVIKLRGGGLSDDEVNAVTHLVASAVDNLSPENVTLIGADGRTPLVAKGHDAMRGGYAPVELETAMAEKLVATLAPIVGADHVKASVTVAYDQSTADTTQQTYDPANPVLLTDQVQEEHFGGSPPAGIPGTPSNVPAAPASGAAGAKTPAGQPAAGANTAGKAAQANTLNPIVSISSESDGQHSETRTFAVSNTLRHESDPAGRIQKIAAAVLVDDFVESKDEKGKTTETRRKRTPEEMKQIADLAKAAIGFDATRGDLLSVENVSFLEAPAEKLVPLPIVERVRVMVQNWMWLVRYLVLLGLFAVVYLFVLRPVKEQVLKNFQLAGTRMAALAGGENLSPEEMAALGPGQVPAAATGGAAEIARVIELKKHLTDKVKREPAQASILIRQWLNEGKKGP